MQFWIFFTTLYFTDIKKIEPKAATYDTLSVIKNCAYK